MTPSSQADSDTGLGVSDTLEKKDKRGGNSHILLAFWMQLSKILLYEQCKRFHMVISMYNTQCGCVMWV